MMIPFLLAMAGTAPAPTQVALPPEDRWALVIGLRRELGAPFVIHNLAQADGDCRLSGSCVTAREAVAQANGAVGDAATLIAQSRVGRANPAAIVSIRGAYPLRSGVTRVLASVYDPATGRWSDRSGTVATAFGGANVDGGRRLVTWAATELPTATR